MAIPASFRGIRAPRASTPGYFLRRGEKVRSRQAIARRCAHAFGGSFLVLHGNGTDVAASGELTYHHRHRHIAVQLPLDRARIRALLRRVELRGLACGVRTIERLVNECDGSRSPVGRARRFG